MLRKRCKSRKEVDKQSYRLDLTEVEVHLRVPRTPTTDSSVSWCISGSFLENERYEVNIHAGRDVSLNTRSKKFLDESSIYMRLTGL